jgi:NADPH-dependent curcumin reductase
MSLTRRNRRVVLAARPKGEPQDTDFRLEQVPVPQPADHQVLLRILYLSLDPYMRGRMNEGPSYAPPVPIGEVMEGGTVAKVIASRSPQWKPGDLVLSYSGWQEYAVAEAEGLRKLDPSLAPVSTALGVLGMPGLTAYTGLLTIGQPKAGETVVVSAASGAVGSVVGQMAKIQGTRVVGIAMGVSAAVGLSRLVKSFLFETQPHDPATLALAGVVLLSAAILAGYASARRASRMDLLAALRHE